MFKENLETEEFVPFSITIETEEEAKLLWHLLNIGIEESINSYTDINEGDGTPDPIELDEFANELFELVEENYTEEGWK